MPIKVRVRATGLSISCQGAAQPWKGPALARGTNGRGATRPSVRLRPPVCWAWGWARSPTASAVLPRLGLGGPTIPILPMRQRRLRDVGEDLQAPRVVGPNKSHWRG